MTTIEVTQADIDAGERKPQRIQLRRAKGWRKPQGAVVVARPSKWGNPYRVAAVGSCDVSDQLRSQFRNRNHWHAIWPDGDTWCYETRGDAAARVVEVFRCSPVVAEWDTRPLAGRDLACWCPLDQPCHANVLLELANGAAFDAGRPVAPFTFDVDLDGDA